MSSNDGKKPQRLQQYWLFALCSRETTHTALHESACGAPCTALTHMTHQDLPHDTRAELTSPSLQGPHPANAASAARSHTAQDMLPQST